MKTVLFVCVHNSGRSQMAEAFFNQMSGGKAIALSAGTSPSKAVNLTVVAAMREAGMDISRNKPKLLTLEMLEQADKVVTMGCNVQESCPASFVPSEDWELEDPEGKPLEKVGQIRDEIKNRVMQLVKELDINKETLSD